MHFTTAARAVVTIATVLVCNAAANAAPTSITTYPADPNGGVGSFDYYVQTFTSPTDTTLLTGLTVNVRAEGPSVTLAIYDWTGANANNIVDGSFADIEGTPLFHASIQTSVTPGLPAGFFDVSVAPQVNLTPNTLYGIVILPNNPSGQADNLAAWSYGLTPYGDGEYFTRISEANHWSSHGGADLAFTAAFCSPFPGGGSTGGCFPGPGPFPASEPATLALVGAALLGAVATRRRATLRKGCHRDTSC